MINPYPFFFKESPIRQTCTSLNSDGELIFSIGQEEAGLVETKALVIDDAKDHLLKLIANIKDGNGIQSAFIEKLKQCEHYKSLYSKMKPFSKVTILSKYKKQPKKFYATNSNWKKLDEFIQLEGVVLPKGQVLFHGGDWPDGTPCVIGQTLKINKAFSTTLDPSVARVHSLYPPSKNKAIWLITLGNVKQPAYVFNPNRGTLSHEVEILFHSGLIAEIKDVQYLGDAMIIDVWVE